MLEIHVYGHLKKKFDPSARLSEQTVIQLPHIEGERFFELLKRIDLSKRDCGDCFINGRVAMEDTLVPEGARVALFPLGMHLLCGGQHLKGHGFITKPSSRDVEYY